MPNMRCVTRKPPNTFTAASATAINPMTVPMPDCAGPAASIAPTIMMPEIAFVTAINGVCSAGVTFHTTWYPTKIANTKTLRLSTTGSTAFTMIFLHKLFCDGHSVLAEQGRGDNIVFKINVHRTGLVTQQIEEIEQIACI